MKGRTERGFAKHANFKTAWHGEVRVQESSAALIGPCVWIFAELSYSNKPNKNAPYLHLSLEEAYLLRDGLSDFIRDARAGRLTEKVTP
jgi:hypothetical protein